VIDVDRILPGGARAAQPAALLVRPDGHIAFKAVPEDAAGMAALDLHS
jgi:hypothetical protein